MKIALNKENSGWVIDKIANDFIKYTRHEIVPIKGDPDLFWGCDCFPFGKFKRRLKEGCKTCVQIHHIVEEKLKEYDFDSFNKADCVITPSHITEDALKGKIHVPVHYLSYWLLSEMMEPRDEKRIEEFRSETWGSSSSDDYLKKEVFIGYFQKDTERNGNPKLEKGPDRFLEVIRGIKDDESIKLRVFLTGYRREYVWNGLSEMGVDLSYSEKVDDMNLYYDSMDWYFCTSRVEGGPQSILESSYRKLKILSTDCGIAKDVLHPDCICKDTDEMIRKFKEGVDRTDWNYENVKKNYLPETVIPKWDDFFEELVKK